MIKYLKKPTYFLRYSWPLLATLLAFFLAHFGTLRRMDVAVFLPRLLTGLFSLSLRKKPFSIRDEAVTNRVE